MYAVGQPHPLREPAVAVLQAITDEKLMAVTSTEVFQEILHRYHHIGAIDKGLALFDTFHLFMSGRIIDTTLSDLLVARHLLEKIPQLDARDAMHAAVMQNNGISTIISADKAFAHIKGLQWIPLSTWAS